MARIKQKRAKKGSKMWLQLAVNECSDLFSELIAQRLHPKPSIMELFSPLRCDDYAEYSDQDFIDLLELELKSRPLDKFWPKGGPNWDALAKTDRCQVLLVEAKAHIDEMKRPGSSAKDCESIGRSIPTISTPTA